MNLETYKTNTLARADIVDIVMIEPVEKVPVVGEDGKKTGEYKIYVHETATGKTRCKFDVHLVQATPKDVVMADGSMGVEMIERDVIEQITVVDQGKETEEVVFRARVEPIDVRTTMQKVQIFLPEVPYVRVEALNFDAKEVKAEFVGVKDNADGTVTKEKVFGWIDAEGKPQTRIVANPEL